MEETLYVILVLQVSLPLKAIIVSHVLGPALQIVITYQLVSTHAHLFMILQVEVVNQLAMELHSMGQIIKTLIFVEEILITLILAPSSQLSLETISILTSPLNLLLQK